MTVLPLALSGPVCRAMAQNASQASVADGGALYAELCALCHGDQGEGFVVERAPALGNQDFLAVASEVYGILPYLGLSSQKGRLQ